MIMSDAEGLGEISVERRCELIRNVECFQWFDPELLARLAAEMTVVRFEPDVNIVTQGEYGDSMYVIVSGQAEVWVNSAAGVVKISSMKEGDLVGQIALVNSSNRRSATVHAVTNIVALRLTAEQFESIASEYPDFRSDLAADADALLMERIQALMKAKSRASGLAGEAR